MPDSKISGLTSATTPLAGTEVLPIVQSGVTTQVSVANLTAGRGISVTTLSMSGQLTNTLATGTAPFVITSTTRVSNLNVATAGTADTLTTARNINEVSFNGSANITVPRVRAIDNRTAAPSAFTTAYATIGFGSWNNNNTSPYADYIVFRTYTDATGGSDNMVSFSKNAIGMRVWQQTYGSASAFATYKDVAFTDSSITGNAATATALQNTRTLWGQNFNGTANVTGSLTSVGDITGTAGVTLTATGGTLGLVATGANVITASTNATERMRIDSAGNVGIGVTPNASWGSTQRVLDIAGASTAHVVAQANGVSVGTNYYVTTGGIATYHTTGQNATRYWQTTSGQHQWYNAPSGTAGTAITFTQAMTLDASGNLGIGVTPSAWGNAGYSVINAKGNASFIGLNAGGTNTQTLVGNNWYDAGLGSPTYIASNFATRYTQFGGQHLWSTAPSGTAGNAITFTQVMTLDASGNLLVGTTSNPGVLNTSVVINSGASSLAGLVLQNNATGSTSTDGSHITIVGTELRIVNSENAPTLFSNNGSERMRITSAGDVGIGTSSPSGKLHVYGGAIRTNTRVTNSQNYPLGHYSPGECVFEIDPTWTEAELQAFFNSSAVTWAAVADAPGGYCIYIDGAVNVGGVYNSGFSYIPVDTSDVYYMECWIQNVGSNQGHYMGSVDYNQSFSSLGGNPGSYGYWVMSNTDPGTTWTKVSGYIQGFGTAVSQFVAGTKYWTPMALFNYTAGTGTRACRISGWKVIRAYQPGNRFFSGNVGIGTSSPGAKLEVSSTGTSISRFIGTQGGTLTTYFQNPAIFANSQAYTLDFEYTDGAAIYTAARIKTFRTGGSKETYLSFETTPTAGVVTERMRITAAGNVGIGTSSPARILDVAGTTRIADGSAVEWGGTSAAIAGASSSNTLFFYTSSAERMRIISSGEVGIGVTPAATVNLDIGAAGGSQLRVQAVTNGVDCRLGATGGAGNAGIVGTYSNHATVLYTNSTERMRITSAGNIHTPAGATTMTDGFIYIPAAAGVPTGAATAITGTVPLYYNSSSNTLYAYNSSWQTISGGLSLLSTNANGVVYLNGSSQATTNTKLQFNGDILSLGGAATAGWVTGAPILEIGNWLAFDQTTGITSTNVYYDSGTNYRYIANGAATICGADSNGFIWYHNSGGTAGASFAPTERMRLASTGELGIGQAPSSGIQVDVTNASLTQIRARATTNGVDSRLVSDSSGLLGYTGTISNHPFAVYTNNTERMRITAAGAMQLSPTSGEGGELNLLNPTGGTVGGYVDVSTANNFRLWTGNLNATMQIGQLSSTGGNIQFYTEASERMRITSTGTVGIGTSTTSGAGLDVKNDAGGILVYAYGDTATAGNVSIIARNTDVGAGSLAQFGLWNDQNPFSGFNASLQYYSNASTIPNEFRIVQGASAPMTFYTNTAERLRVTENGNIVDSQPAQSAQNTSATLTIAQIRTRIITANAAVTLTLPTGTTLDTYATGMPTNAAFEVTFIATAAAAITIGANGNTTVGSLTVAANTSGTYRFRKTAANTFTVYRL